MKQVTEITDYDQQVAFISNNPKCVIFFGSERCPHCRNIVPVVENLASKFPNIKFAHVEVSKVNVDNVNGVPVFVLYKNQTPVNVIEGPSAETLNRTFENNF